MHYKILLIIFFAFISKSYATEVNGNFKDECKYLKTQIEKDIAFLS